jgi:hypothetical protein
MFRYMSTQQINPTSKGTPLTNVGEGEPPFPPKVGEIYIVGEGGWKVSHGTLCPAGEKVYVRESGSYYTVLLGLSDGKTYMREYSPYTSFPHTSTLVYPIPTPNQLYRSPTPVSIPPQSLGQISPPLRDVSMGSDPEVFVVDESTGKVVPAFTFLPAKGKGKGGPLTSASPIILFWDGFQAEFLTPSWSCNAYGTDYIQRGLSSLYSRRPPGSKLTGESVFLVDQETLQTGEDKHVELGCSPSINVYGRVAELPRSGRDLPFRMAGFHVHVGIHGQYPTEEKRSEVIPHMVKMMDRLAGVTSVVALQGLEHPLRRRYYGLAGEYRQPSYGVEYRTLSSGVLWHPALVHLHLDLVRYAQLMVRKGFGGLYEGSDEEIQECVNNLDVDLGKRLVERNRQLLGSVLGGHYLPAKGREGIVVDLLKEGMAQHITLDMEENWLLPQGVWASHSNNSAKCFASWLRDHLAKVG